MKRRNEKMVRSYIITETEVRIIKAFLKNGEKLPGFRMLKKRVKNVNPPAILTQIDLIIRFQVKLKEPK